MSRLEAGVGNEPIEFFIFDSISKIFFHIYERADWKISRLPYDQLQRKVDEAYVDCNAVQARYPNVPSPEEKAAMTDSLKWGPEASTPTKYQLEMLFDPQHRNSSFISCFDNKITDWIDQYNEEQNDYNLQFITGILVGVVVLGIVACLGYAAYHKYQKNKSLWDWDSSDSKTTDEESTEQTHLLWRPISPNEYSSISNDNDAQLNDRVFNI